MWRKIDIQRDLIKPKKMCDGFIVKFPFGSSFYGFQFVIPNSMLGTGRKPNCYSIEYPKRFVFHLRKYGRKIDGTIGVLEKRDVDYKVIEEEFGE